MCAEVGVRRKEGKGREFEGEVERVKKNNGLVLVCEWLRGGTGDRKGRIRSGGGYVVNFEFV